MTTVIAKADPVPRRSIQKVVEASALPDLAGLTRSEPPRAHSVLVRSQRALDNAASNDRAAPRRGSVRDQLRVFRLERRVRNLKDIEDAHLNLLRQIRQVAGDAHVPDLARPLQLQQ